MTHAQYVGRISVFAWFLGCGALLVSAEPALGQGSPIDCPDGVHYEIDIKSLALEYSGHTLTGTLSSLSALGLHLKHESKTLQKAAAATQQWNEYLKGLVAGYNSCAITKTQYNEGLKRVYPRLKEDAASLERLREMLAQGRQIDESRLKHLLDQYFKNLQAFATISGKGVIIERITAVVERESNTLQNAVAMSTEQILERLNELEAKVEEAPVPKPEDVTSEVKQRLLAKADEAEAAYKNGYALFQQYRFDEALPHFERALSIIELPEFYLALGSAWRFVPDLHKAEQVLREGLQLAASEHDRKNLAALYTNLGFVLLDQRQFSIALQQIERALRINQDIYGSQHPIVALELQYLSTILQAQGNLAGALEYAQRALRIDEAVYGSDHPTVAIRLNNIATILLAKDDLAGALEYAQRALQIFETVYGPDHFRVALLLNNIGKIFQAQGDLPRALKYIQRALRIYKKLYGPNDSGVALLLNNIGQIFQAKGDLPRTLEYTQRALRINENVFGPYHPYVALLLNNIGQIFQAQGDLPRALKYTQRALRIDEAIYGSNHPTTAITVNNIGQILKAQGDLSGALQYTQRAYKILKDTYGSDHVHTQITRNNLKELKARAER